MVGKIDFVEMSLHDTFLRVGIFDISERVTQNPIKYCVRSIISDENTYTFRNTIIIAIDILYYRLNIKTNSY